jgi:hypothetical protein
VYRLLIYEPNVVVYVIGYETFYENYQFTK